MGGLTEALLMGVPACLGDSNDGGVEEESGTTGPLEHPACSKPKIAGAMTTMRNRRFGFVRIELSTVISFDRDSSSRSRDPVRRQSNLRANFAFTVEYEILHSTQEHLLMPHANGL